MEVYNMLIVKSILTIYLDLAYDRQYTQSTTRNNVEAAMSAIEIPDPQNPEYFLDSFPRDDFPRYAWTDRPATLPETAWTTETTHRDGQQGGLPLTVEQSL